MKTLKGNQTWISEENRSYATIIKEEDGLLLCKFSNQNEIVTKTKKDFAETIKDHKRLDRKSQKEYSKGFESGEKFWGLSGGWQDEGLRKSQSGSDCTNFEVSFYIWLYWNGYKDGRIWAEYKNNN